MDHEGRNRATHRASWIKDGVILDRKVAGKIIKTIIALLKENGIKHYQTSEVIRGNSVYLDVAASIKVENIGK